MNDLVYRFFYSEVQKHLTDVLDYGYIHEVFEVSESVKQDGLRRVVVIGYRGENLEYNTVELDGTLADLVHEMQL